MKWGSLVLVELCFRNVNLLIAPESWNWSSTRSILNVIKFHSLHLSNFVRIKMFSSFNGEQVELYPFFFSVSLAIFEFFDSHCWFDCMYPQDEFWKRSGKELSTSGIIFPRVWLVLKTNSKINCLHTNRSCFSRRNTFWSQTVQEERWLQSELCKSSQHEFIKSIHHASLNDE